MSTPRLSLSQYSALGELRRFGRLNVPRPGQRVNRGTLHGFSRRTLDALVTAGYARWFDHVSIVPTPADPGDQNPPLCVQCFEDRHGYEPDMGDDVTWEPGDCHGCPRHAVIVFRVTG